MTYPGGKAGSGAAHRIINLMPPHARYFEPFAGSAAVARLKLPASSSFLIDLDPAAVDMLRRQPELQPRSFTIIHGDGLAFLECMPFTPADLVYCDPPYVRSTRKSARDLYNCEMTDHHHARLLAWAAASAARVIISGYRSRMYDEALPAWNSEDFKVMTRRGNATETLWWNFPRPTVLHDSRYLGEGFRERERIRRRQKRWRSRLDRMGAAERNALIGIIREMDFVE